MDKEFCIDDERGVSTEERVKEDVYRLLKN